MTTIILDFESRSQCDLKRSGAPRYAADATTEILCLCWRIDDEFIEAWHPGEPIEATSLWRAIRAGATLVAHKASFEKSIWRYIMVPDYGWPIVPNSQWHDTLAVCAMKAIPQGLDQATRVLGLKNLKDSAGSRFTVALSKIDKRGYMPTITPETIERVDLYCADDVHAQAGLHRRLGWLPPAERQVWLLDQRINERGFRVDMPLVRAMKAVVDKATVPLAAEYRGLTGGLSFTQGEKTKVWCAEHGFPIPDLQAGTVAGVLGYSPDMDEDDYLIEPVAMPDEVRRALSIRQLIGSAAVKKLGAAITCVMDDGRIRDSLQYHGAGTGRWSGRLLQPHNFPRGTIKAAPEALVAAIMTEDPAHVEELFGPPVGAVVSSLKHIIVAGPGRVLVGGDFSQVEFRISTTVAGCKGIVKLMADGGDPYCDLASQIYKRSITKADPIERDIGKHSVLGLDRGMGPDKFHWKYAAGQTLEFCTEVVRVFRKEWAPEIPTLWRGLMRAATDAVWDKKAHDAYGVRYLVEDQWLTAELPSGRKLWYFNPQPIRETMPWDHTDVRSGWTYQAQKTGQWRTVKAFGGQLLNNFAEGFARDLLTTAMFKCEKAGLPVVLTVHDSIIAEPLEKDADVDLLNEIMVDIPDWARQTGVPIKAECWAGDRMK